MSQGSQSVIHGRVWLFGDGMNTDLILPIHATLGPRAEQPQYVFEANRPGWAAQVNRGDVIIAGRNFGIGSGRPAARVLLDLGIAGVAAESVNGLFLRNAVSSGLPCLEIPGVTRHFAEGDIAEFDMDAATARKLPDGSALPGKQVPESLRLMMLGGGIMPFLVSNGYIRSAV